MKLRVPAAIGLLAVLVLGTGLARGATGDVSYVSCISGEIASASSCAQTPSASVDGEESGLDGAESATVTADGRSAYVAAEDDAAIVSFARNRTTGALTFASCIGGETTVSNCGEIPTATGDGVDSGLQTPDTVIASADGKSVYAAAVDDDAVATFNRDPATGELSYVGCRSGVSGLAACTPITGATATGDDSGLNTPTAFSLSPDGTSLYVAASDDSSIARFARDPATGALTYAGCLSGESDAACTPISGATATGDNSGLDGVNGVATSPDGTSVYATGDDDDALARFARDTGSGALTYAGCQSTDSAVAACTQLPGAVAGGLNTGLDQINSVVVAPEGNSIHATAFADASIATFTRDPATGATTYTGCISGETASAACTQIPSASATGEDSGLDSPIGIGAAPDGLTIHAAGNGDAALVNLARNPATGALTYAGCISGETQTAGCTQIASAAADGTGSGLDAPRAAALSADGRAVYVPSATDDAIATFAREGLACKGSPVTSVGSAVPDSLSGTEEADVIAAGDGDDAISGLGGGDLLCGEAGNDAVSGGDGNDSAEGGDGADTVKGNDGKDKLKGNDGKDKLKGNAGKDKLNGGPGKDKCDGGGGKDKAGSSCEKTKKVP